MAWAKMATDNAALCFVMCVVMLHCALVLPLCYVVLCGIVLVLCCAMLCCAVVYCVVRCCLPCVLWCSDMVYCVVLMLCWCLVCGVPYFIVLYYVVLVVLMLFWCWVGAWFMVCCFVLCCAALCRVMCYCFVVLSFGMWCMRFLKSVLIKRCIYWLRAERWQISVHVRM